MFPLLFLLVMLVACQEVPKGVDLDKYRQQYVKGVVVVSPTLEKRIPKGDIYLFLSLREPDSAMPVAVLRTKNPSFPFHFNITGKHKLSHDKPMEGLLILTARISTKPVADVQKGDLLGFTQVKVGTSNNRVIIDRVVE